VEFTKTDDEGRTVHGYEYDEYEIVVKYYDGLQHDIESAFADWLVTGRTLEFNERATAACITRTAGSTSWLSPCPERSLTRSWPKSSHTS